MTNLILIDSNILVYAHNKQSVNHKPANKIVSQLLRDGTIALTPQNLFELYRILTQKIPKPLNINEAILLMKYYQESVSMVIPSIESTRLAFSIAQRYGVLGAKIFDAHLTATMISNNIHTIYTANVKDFAPFEPLIQVINPLSQ